MNRGVATLLLVILQCLLFDRVASHNDCGFVNPTEDQVRASRSADRKIFGKLVS
jgi:hypothetical protein